jgi:copper(I)-binding protein
MMHLLCSKLLCGMILCLCCVNFCSYAAFASSRFVISKSWVRMPVEGAYLGSLYFTIYNASETSDYIVSVACDLAEETSMSKTVKINGISKSVMIDKVTLPAGTEVKFQPMGIHVLLKNIKSSIKQGSKLKITLFFAHSPPVTFFTD